MITIIEDTAQKKGEHDIKHSCLDKMGVQVIRNKLPFGDYALPPKVSVDTKRNMEEIAQNIGSDHARFRNECVRAKNAGCKLYFLIETEWEDINSVDDVHIWVNPQSIYSKRAITGERLEKAMKTLQERYGCTFLFCRPTNSADIIMKLLLGGDSGD